MGGGILYKWRLIINYNRFPLSSANFLTSWQPVVFPRRTLTCAVICLPWITLHRRQEGVKPVRTAD
jgi:hypothetical protein